MRQSTRTTVSPPLLAVSPSRPSCVQATGVHRDSATPGPLLLCSTAEHAPQQQRWASSAHHIRPTRQLPNINIVAGPPQDHVTVLVAVRGGHAARERTAVGSSQHCCMYIFALLTLFLLFCTYFARTITCLCPLLGLLAWL